MSRPSPPRPGAQDTDLREVQVRAITFAVLLLLILGLLMARLAKRQIVEAGEWRQKAISQQTPIRSVSAYRGDIRTRDGKVLARSVRTRSAFAEPRRFGQRTRTRRGVTIEPTTQADRERVAHTIGEALGQDARQIRELADRFANPRRQAFCWVERRLDDQRALALEQARLRGVGFQTEYRRTYPCGTLAAHVLGFTGLEASGALTGQSGVERGFDVYLKGIDGRREVVRDGQGDALLTEGNLLMAPIDGAEVTLTLDSRVQAIAERAALKGAEEWNPEGIAVVCLEPQTGRILALASWPSFDPADLNGLTEDKALREAEAQRLYGRSDASLDSEERAAVTKAVLERVTRNRPLMDPYEPGSTLKPLVAAAGVEIGAINPTERIDCAGPFRVAGKAVTDVHPHGALPLRGVISKSSNVGMVKIALRMGFEAVHTSLVGAGF
ncbi:MAG: peptidoglycan D,D-transpeptidase FtsI family protein, partial [Planctomycetota bacterium]